MKSTIQQLLALICICLFSFGLCADEVLDLETMESSFVLETKQIQIPGYPKAFNPSIVRWNGSLLMCFRYLADPKDLWISKVGLVWLDEEYNPIGTPQLLDTRVSLPHIPSRSEDPRLYVVGNRLFVTYNDNEEKEHGGVRRIYYGELEYDGTTFHEKTHIPLLFWQGADKDTWEKNWIPFEYKNTMHFIYSVTPHFILSPKRKSSSCTTIASTDGGIHWPWGRIRGGTPPYVVGNEYLSFYHSCKVLRSKQTDGKELHHYFMGAYTFSAEPPFHVTQISAEPIIGKEFYSGTTYKRIHKHVVFPGGYIFDDQHLWVIYGREDSEIWVAKIERAGLFKSLIPVNTFYSYTPQK